ncbi:class I lanthipeptide [Parachitinimonas caeni]|uniref:Class I lanthipeptide n=1 Tax=Parachitinimonas caeni TaxID=3031301 RepID=A0ABT7DZ47_9NEIS|nr:class I lanthipeptide [Parachitinimonas caeni]MDK2125321.1 class I lanthipeptide [Parachitinimonas caeni]
MQKLKLNKKTLRSLTEDELNLVAGGARTDETDFCPSENCDTEIYDECHQPTDHFCTETVETTDCPPEPPGN